MIFYKVGFRLVLTMIVIAGCSSQSNHRGRAIEHQNSRTRGVVGQEVEISTEVSERLQASRRLSRRPTNITGTDPSSIQQQFTTIRVRRLCEKESNFSYIVHESITLDLEHHGVNKIRALICLAINNDTEGVRKGLRESGGDLYGSVALLTLIKHKGEAAAIALIDAGVSVNIFDQRGRTPLMIASEEGLERAVIELITNGANVNIVSRSGRNALMYAARANNRGIIFVLIRAKSLINFRDKRGMTALLHGVSKNSIISVDALLEEGADFEEADDQGQTPLALAAIFGYREIAQALIEKGASIDRADAFGRTPLMQAVLFGREGIIDDLLEAGADESLRDMFGDTVLKFAKSRRNKRLVKFFETKRKKREPLTKKLTAPLDTGDETE